MSASDDLSGRHTSIGRKPDDAAIVERSRPALLDGPSGAEFHPDFVRVRQPDYSALGLEDPEGRN